MSYINRLLTDPITEEVLKAHHCLEKVDRVDKDPETTKFGRALGTDSIARDLGFDLSVRF